MKQFFKKCYLAIILIFLYIPIVVLICQSFNAGKSRAKWEGFSFRWYTELFQDTRIMNALTVTVTIALLAMVVATILGTLAAIGIHAMKKRPQSFMMTLTNLPNTMPDIVTGISLMLLFLSEIAGYRTPLFITFKKAKEDGLNILKGSGSLPVFFWKLYIRNTETRKKIELAEYYRPPQEQRRQYDVLPAMR